jgi:hypothetical protein
VVPSSFFDKLLAVLDEPASGIPALQEAGEQARRLVIPR